MVFGDLVLLKERRIAGFLNGYMKGSVWKDIQWMESKKVGLVMRICLNKRIGCEVSHEVRRIGHDRIGWLGFVRVISLGLSPKINSSI